MKTLKTLSVFGLGVAMILTSCNKDQDLGGPSLSQPQQSMKVRMTDNPGNYESLNVEIESVSAFNSSSGEWIELNGNTQVVSVLELTNGNEQEIAMKNKLEAGLYTKLKIEFSQNNELTLNATASAGTSSSLINIGLNVGQTSTINETVILEINEQISANSNASILLDFNVVESVIESTGNYILDPHIVVIADESTGVQGSIENDTRAALEFDLDGSLMTDYTAYTNDQGQFMVRGMADGTYTLTIMPDQDEDPSLNTSYTYTGVVVVNGEITSLGELQLQ